MCPWRGEGGSVRRRSLSSSSPPATARSGSGLDGLARFRALRSSRWPARAGGAFRSCAPRPVALVAGTAVGIAPALRPGLVAAVPVAVAWRGVSGRHRSPPLPTASAARSPTSPVATWRALGRSWSWPRSGSWRDAPTLRDCSTCAGRRQVVRWSIVGFLVAGAARAGPRADLRPAVSSARSTTPWPRSGRSSRRWSSRSPTVRWRSSPTGAPCSAGRRASWASGPPWSGRLSFSGSRTPGADVAGNGPVLSLALGTGGLIAGIIAVRTRSLLLPMAHPHRARHPDLLRVRVLN